MIKRVVVLILTLGLLVGGVAVAAAQYQTQPAPTVQTKHNDKLGTILADSKNKTLYVFAKDTKPGESACYGGCATAWPPLTTTGNPTLASGVPGTLGTITRTDGTKQVTYNGKPLYYYAKDEDDEDAYGQGIGGVWSVVMPAAAGTPVASPAASPAAATSGAAAMAVEIKSFAFNPADLTVAVGTKVTWTNDDTVAHTVTAEDNSFDSGNLDPGKSFSFTFSKAGTYQYHCKYHANMVATITVK